MAAHDAFLRAIADNPDDNAPRLIYSDWLAENGDLARSALIRVQCELASRKLSKKRREMFRAAEHFLLETHRRPWLKALGLPVEDVCFERGLVAKMRLTRWNGGRMLKPRFAPRLAGVTELDMSGLQLGDAGLAAFAKAAELPALRKLILSDNGITDAGAAALAAAAGLPRLETVYLFGNPITTAARSALRRSRGFRLKNLDVGKRAQGYCMSAGEAEVARRQYIRRHLLPGTARYFAASEHLRSAMLYVAQFFADEAEDAVYGVVILSEWSEPKLKGVAVDPDESYVDPNLPNIKIERGKRGVSSSAFDILGPDWDSNGRAIPLWAAFASEDGTQEHDYYSDVFSPAVLFYRHGGYEILPMLRPHLDGIQPVWDWEVPGE